MTSAKSRIREVVKTSIEESEELVMPTLTDKIVAMLRNDTAFMDDFISATLREAVYEQVQIAVSRSRKFVLLGDQALTPGAVERRAAQFASRFLGWFEHAGDRHVSLMEMTRKDLYEAAEERRTRGTHELRLATLWEQMAQKMTDGQRVQERFTAEEIEGLYTRIESAEQKKAKAA